MKAFISYIFNKMFSAKTPAKLALAATLGLLVGMLSFVKYKTAVIFACSAVFGLNIICMLAGTLFASLFPAFSLLAYEVIHRHPSIALSYLSANWLPYFRASVLARRAMMLLICAVFFFILRFVFGIMLRKTEKAEHSHVFHDISGTRWPITQVVLVVACLAAAAVMAMATASFDRDPLLPRYNYNYRINSFSGISAMPKNFRINSLTAKDRYYMEMARRQRRMHRHAAARRQKNVYAFYVGWDEASLDSLRRNIKYIGTVLTDWYGLDKNGALITANRKPNVDKLIAAVGRRQEPFVNNYIGNDWNAGVLHGLITNKAKTDKFISDTLADVEAHHYAGLNIDFEGLRTEDKSAFSAFMKKLCDAYHAKKLEVTIDLPAENDSYDYAKLFAACDRVIVMLYDEHSAASYPGTIASEGWVDSVLQHIDYSGEKLIVALGNYGLDWTLDHGAHADQLSFSDVMSICSQNHIDAKWDKATQNPYLAYKEQGDRHLVWFLDAATFYNQMKQSLDSGAGGIAVWRLGSEDESIWDIIANINKIQHNDTIRTISNIKAVLIISYSGKGDIIHVEGSEQNGRRSYKTDRDGYIDNEHYISYPANYVVKKFGSSPNKEIALTFDDGPDPYYTPKILKILEENNVPASFFLIGENAEDYPSLVEREYIKGDDIGNHTFTHPNVLHISGHETELELNATQRVIQEITGHSTILFRAPYNADSNPSGLEEFVPVLRAQKIGYLMVGESIDPNDWESPGKNAIISRVMNNLKDGNIVLLHDGGGRRDDTLAALPELIAKLKAAGYKFVTVSQLLNTRRDVVMAPAEKSDPFLLYDKVFFRFVGSMHNAVEYIFYITVTLGILKLLFLSLLSLRQKRRYSKLKHDDSYRPFVSVLIPCYNEAKVICETVKSVLRSNYEGFEVIVIDDGSTDNSYELVSSSFRDDARVTCFTKENGGKSRALNLGLEHAKGSIFIAIDADTIFDKDAIRLMVRYFADPQVAAVSGNVKVGNRGKIVTEWQHCEYVTGFNLERRAYSELNCITVVPGAIGAWRKDAALAEGGFKTDTLAEDTDMTLTLLEKGYRIAFEENARAYTETPETFRSLLKQRFRWTYGTLQCLWKHRHDLFSKKQKTLGFIAMPFMWIFQYIFQTLCPIVDIYMIFSILFGSSSENIILSYLAFLGVDIVTSLFAFRLEGEKLLPLLWMPIQRLAYRFIMAYIVLKSIGMAVIGKTVGWNKLKRTGSAANRA